LHYCRNQDTAATEINLLTIWDDAGVRWWFVPALCWTSETTQQQCYALWVNWELSVLWTELYMWLCFQHYKLYGCQYFVCL